jgi:hypothetical protein
MLDGAGCSMHFSCPAGTNLSDLAGCGSHRQARPRHSPPSSERLTLLRAIGIDPDIAVGSHPERLRRLCQEGVRLTCACSDAASDAASPTLVATILETIVTLTDDAVLMFDSACLGRCSGAKQQRDTIERRNRRTINGKIRLLAQLGAALLAAKIL